MRGKLAHIGILMAVSLWAIQQSSYAQQTEPCRTSHAEDEPIGPEISIAEVTFSGSLQMPLSDQSEIAVSIKDKTHGTSLDLVTEEALERVRAGWQDRGYFKAGVTGDTKTLSSNPVNQRIALSIHVDEGVRYTLRRITFKDNKAIRSVELLRGLFPIADGDILNREKIATGLENLREAYGDLGYINFTAVPDTTFDEENKAVSIAVDLDEGKQFYVSSVNVFGLDDAARRELLNDFPIKRGAVFSSRLWEKSLLKYASMQPDCPCRGYQPRHLDEQSATVAVTLDFRPCTD
jgi:outer membrane protein insertion porin family